MGPCHPHLLFILIIDIININILIDIDIERGVLPGLLCWTHSWDGDSFCWRWCNQEGEMLILSLNTDVPSPLGGWTDTQLIGVQIHIKEFESSSCKHTKLPHETAVEVLQGCKAHILPANVVQKQFNNQNKISPLGESGEQKLLFVECGPILSQNCN